MFLAHYFGSRRCDPSGVMWGSSCVESGGIAALNPRLRAWNPPGSGTQTDRVPACRRTGFRHADGPGSGQYRAAGRPSRPGFDACHAGGMPAISPGSRHATRGFEDRASDDPGRGRSRVSREMLRHIPRRPCRASRSILHETILLGGVPLDGRCSFAPTLGLWRSP